MVNLIKTMKNNRIIQTTFMISLILVLAFILFNTNSSTSAQEEYTGTKWQYLEINFNTAVTFGDNVSAGYFINGNFVQPDNPEVIVRGVIGAYGNNGWELVTVNSSQIFIFKRLAQ